MSVTLFRSGFCHVCGGGGSGSNFLPYTHQHFLSGCVSQKMCKHATLILGEQLQAGLLNLKNESNMNLLMKNYRYQLQHFMPYQEIFISKEQKLSLIFDTIRK
jgi:hypothetical protein